MAFGEIDPIFRNAVPAWNPLDWQFENFGDVMHEILFGSQRRVFVRTILYVASAVVLSFLVGYPVAYYLARHAGRWRGLLLALMILPFWVNYLMRMLAWVNLLQVDGWATRAFSAFGLQYNWLDGKAITVVLGLVYGYVPFLVLPLYASLERLDVRLLEAARDLGARPGHAFRMVTMPLSRPGMMAAGVIIALPMFGDYYTNDMLSRSPRTEMIGNQVDFYINGTSQPQKGAVLVLVLSAMLVVFMSYYLVSTMRMQRELQA
ncbi:MAG: ABC transporter permease [Actinobacteria bacterium]|nr:ABC transporter permease [Actinomycetota bacterium]